MKSLQELVAIERPMRKNPIKTHDWIICDKCAGRGTIELYRHRDNGKCWQCGGKGKIFTHIKSER